MHTVESMSHSVLINNTKHLRLTYEQQVQYYLEKNYQVFKTQLHRVYLQQSNEISIQAQKRLQAFRDKQKVELEQEKARFENEVQQQRITVLESSDKAHEVLYVQLKEKQAKQLEQFIKKQGIAHDECVTREKQCEDMLLAQLKKQYKLILHDIGQEYQRIVGFLQNPSFFNQYIHPGLKAIAHAVTYFFSHHSWAIHDEQLIHYCFDYQQQKSPWASWYNGLLRQIRELPSFMQYSTLDEYSVWSTQAKPLESTFRAWEDSWPNAVATPSLAAPNMMLYLQHILYAKKQLSLLYAGNQRQGIKSLSYGDNARTREDVDLSFRRVDWLRAINTMLPWSVMARSSDDALSSVLALSLTEVKNYCAHQQVRLFIVNAASEQDPLWFVMQRLSSGKWNIYLPVSEGLFSPLTQRLEQHMPALSNVVNIEAIERVSLAQHSLEKNHGLTLELIWHSVLGARILPFCLGIPGVTQTPLSHYRHTVPISFLLESTLSCALREQEDNNSIYTSREEVALRYIARSFWQEHSRLHAAWVVASNRLAHYKESLNFAAKSFSLTNLFLGNQNLSWASFDHSQEFLRAIDAHAVAIEYPVNQPPVIAVSPIYSAVGSKLSLNKYDFFYLMSLVYQQQVQRVDCASDAAALAQWSKHWPDDAKEFLVTNNLLIEKKPKQPAGLRNLLDCNITLTTVTGVAAVFPEVLKYAAACAARNRLMSTGFSSNALNSSNAMNDLWDETGARMVHVLVPVAQYSEEELLAFCSEVTHFTGAQSASGWMGRGCPDERNKALQHIWPFAQIAQMGRRGLSVLFKQWEQMDVLLPALTFDLNCHYLSAAEYLESVYQYAQLHGQKKLPRINLIMPLACGQLPLAQVMGSLLGALDNRAPQGPYTNANALFLYEMHVQPVALRQLFLTNLLHEVQSKKIITMVVIPSFDGRVSIQNAAECEVHDLYRQLQNAILNNRRMQQVIQLQCATQQLNAYLQGQALPPIDAVLAVKEQLVMPTSTEEAVYVIGGGEHGIQQQLQQSQQKQRQVTQQQHVELMKQVEVEEEIQIFNYRGINKVLWTRETIDHEGQGYWNKLPPDVRKYSGFNAQSPKPLAQLFNLWVGSAQQTSQIVHYIEAEAGLKIMRHAGVFRFGLAHNNLPPGFFLARKEELLVLCFDEQKERAELQHYALAVEQGLVTPKQAKKIILHEVHLPQVMPGGDDRQFVIMPMTLAAEDVKPGYWRHLTTLATKPQGYFAAARTLLQESAHADAALLDARIQASLQAKTFKRSWQPAAAEQEQSVAHIQQWARGFIPNPAFVNALFLYDRAHQVLPIEQIKNHLQAFGQITHVYDPVTGVKEQCGSYLFMRLAEQMVSVFCHQPEYLYIWRDRLLSPVTNWTFCLSRVETEAMVHSMRVLNAKHTHADFWWRLVDAHGTIVGPMHYAPLWASCYQLFQYIDEHELILSATVLQQWTLLMRQEPINGQVLIERILSVLKQIARYAADGDSAQHYQQDILNHLNEINWQHDGFYYACCFEGLVGYWDKDLFTQVFNYNSAARASYIPSFDDFHYVDELEEQKKQEYTAVLRYLARYCAHDAVYYWTQYKPFFQRSWWLNASIQSCDTDERLPLLRLLINSLILGRDKVNEVSDATIQQLVEQRNTPALHGALVKLSKVCSIDNRSAKEKIWSLRFAQLPQVINALASPQCHHILAQLTSASEQSLLLIKHAADALSCFESACFNQMHHGMQSAQQWLALWFVAQQSKPYLRIFPWLIVVDLTLHTLMELEELGGREYQRLKKQMSSIIFARSTYLPDVHNTLMELEELGGREYQRLKKQMSSIIFARSTYLPDVHTIINQLALPSMGFMAFLIFAPKMLSVKQREHFINEAIELGCGIVDQGLGFRIMNEEECAFSEQTFQKWLGKKAYYAINNSLFEQFIRQVAIPEQNQHQFEQLIEQCVNVLSSLHNKPHYNELGLILGTLLQGVSSSSAHADEYYSLPQLLAWLQAFAQAIARGDEQHFPVHLLQELIHAPGAQHVSPGLIKALPRLHECQKHIQESSYKNQCLKLSASSLPNQYNALIVRFMVHSKELSSVARTIQNIFEKQELSKPLLASLYEFLQQPTLLDGRFSLERLNQWLLYFCQTTASGVDNVMHEQAVLDLIAYLTQQIKPLVSVLGVEHSDWRLPLTAVDSLWAALHHQDKTWSSFLWGMNYELQSKLIIIAYATEGSFIISADINLLWEKIDTPAREVLVNYYQSGARLSLSTLLHLVTVNADNESYTSDLMQKKLHHYETVIRATDARGVSKRIYSVLERQELIRVISGFERKGRGPCSSEEQENLLTLFYYLNEYSQLYCLDSIVFSSLLVLCHEAQKDVLSALHREDGTELFASARLLACLREIEVRRDGKWLNHTQTLALLYAARYNDERLLYQIRTGQGKSIFSLLRAAFLALHGYEVDVFSAKESLSHRDFLAARPLLNTLNIPIGYITPQSAVEEYKQRGQDVRNGVQCGAVNFATMGNLMLFLSRNAWIDNRKIKLNPAHRIAFLDEADHILLDDMTQFNLPDPGLECDAYNFDEWAYKVVYQYYCDVLALDNEFTQHSKISRQRHLDALSQQLVSLHTMASEHSNFFREYLLPLMHEDSDNKQEALIKRDEFLVYLLKAAHAAFTMKEGVAFCSAVAQRLILGQVISIRIIQVMINNQVQEGATYSDAVHQMLCIRKNEEVARLGGIPNYFVEPESKIILSQNCRSGLGNYYHKFEGCTGTAGNSQELEQYNNIYQLKHVVKLPTHELMTTEFKPTVYAAGFSVQTQEIANIMAQHTVVQPMLITCQDDKQVRRFYQAVYAMLDINNALLTLCDTNDTGKTESEIVPLAGLVGRAVFSARMGRGTDIQPETEKGLFVLSTHLASARITKQERGRQGRNGAAGIYQSIIDVNELLNEYQVYAALPQEKQRLADLFLYEEQHLAKKIAKHQQKGSTKWDWLAGAQKKTIHDFYLKARVCIQMRQQLQQQQYHALRRYEALIAWMSLAIETLLRTYESSSAQNMRWWKQLKSQWAVCRATLDTHWQRYLSHAKEGDETLQQQHWSAWVRNAALLWGRIITVVKTSTNKDIKIWVNRYDVCVLLAQHQSSSIDESPLALINSPIKSIPSVAHLDNIILLQQKWMERAVSIRSSLAQNISSDEMRDFQHEFDELHTHGLQRLFIALKQLRPQGAESFVMDQIWEQLLLLLDSDLWFMMPSKQAGSVLVEQWWSYAQEIALALPQQPTPQTLHCLFAPLYLLNRVLGGTNNGKPDWLKTVQKPSFSLGDAAPYAYLTSFITDVVLSIDSDFWLQHDESELMSLQQFIEHLAAVLVGYYWESMHEEEFIAKLREVVLWSKERLQRGFVFDVLAKGFPTLESVHALVQMMQQNAYNSRQVVAFKNYLNDNMVLLRQKQFAMLLPFVTDLTLGDLNHLNELPKIDIFGGDSQLNQLFWGFLSQRRPLIAQPIAALSQLIQEHCTTDELALILNSAPYYSIEQLSRMITQIVQSNVLPRQWHALFESARSFNQWQAAQHYIHNALMYAHDEVDTRASRWHQLYESLSPHNAKILYTLIHGKNLSGTLSDGLFTQLVTRSKALLEPWDVNAWTLYIEELSVLDTLSLAWQHALSAAWTQLPQNQERISFLRYLAPLMSNDARALHHSCAQWPSSCYQLWLQGANNEAADSFALLVKTLLRVQYFDSSDSRTTLFIHVIQNLLEFKGDASLWSALVQENVHWLKIYAMLPPSWGEILAPILRDAFVLNVSKEQQWANLLTFLTQHPTNFASESLSGFAQELIAYWNNPYLESANEEHPLDFKQLKQRGLEHVVRIASVSRALNARRIIILAYLQSSMSLSSRIELLLMQEQIINVIAEFPASWQPVLEQQNKAILAQSSLELVQKRTLFLSLLAEESFDDMGACAQFLEHVLNTLWQETKQNLVSSVDALRVAIGDKLNVLTVVHDAANSPKERFIMAQYYKWADQNDSTQEVSLFKAFLTHIPNECTEESCAALWHGVRSHLLQIDEYDSSRSLTKAVTLTMQAQQAAENKSLPSWFNLAQQNTRRIELMRGIQQGYISLGAKQHEACWNYVQQMTDSALFNQPVVLDMHYHQQALAGFKRFSSLLHELNSIVHVAQPLSSRTTQQESFAHDSVTSLAQQHQFDFQQLKQSYELCWWKNSVRTKQAQQLFNGVTAQEHSLTKEQYYQHLIRHILTVQKDIVHSDRARFMTFNKKGYSRLYDVSIKMLLNVASQYLSEECRDLSSRNERVHFIKELLNNSLQAHQAVHHSARGLFQPQAIEQDPAMRYLQEMIEELEHSPIKDAHYPN